MLSVYFPEAFWPRRHLNGYDLIIIIAQYFLFSRFSSAYVKQPEVCRRMHRSH